MVTIGKKFKKETPIPERQKFGLYRALKNVGHQSSSVNDVKKDDILAGFQWLDGDTLKQAIVFPDGHVSLFWSHVKDNDFEYLGPVTEIN